MNADKEADRETTNNQDYRSIPKVQMISYFHSNYDGLQDMIYFKLFLREAIQIEKLVKSINHLNYARPRIRFSSAAMLIQLHIRLVMRRGTFFWLGQQVKV